MAVYTQTAPLVPVEDRMSKEDIDQILAFAIPTLKFSYPFFKSKYADKAIAEAFNWIRENALEKMYKSPKVLEYAVKDDLLDLPTQIFVNAEEKHAPVVCELFLWIFAIDDFLDHPDHFASPETSSSLLLGLNLAIMWSFPDNARLRENLIEIIKNDDAAQLDAALKFVDENLALARLDPSSVYTSPLIDSEPVMKAFLLIWRKMSESSPPDFMLRYGIVFQQYVLANMQEIRNRSHSAIPSLDDYIVMRRNVGGTYICTMIVEFCDQAFLSDELFYGKEFQNMFDAVVDLVSWVNDVWSFKKEALLGEFHNMVCIIKHEKGCTYHEAGMITFQMMNAKLADVEKSFEALRKVTPKEQSRAVEAYIKVCQNFIAAGYDWHSKTSRYKVIKE